MATKKPASAKKAVRPATTKTKVTTVKAKAPVKQRLAALKSTNDDFSLGSASAVPALLAEFVGTFIFATALLAGQGSQTVALFALAAVVFAVGLASGAHVNPAISIGAWIARKISGMRALFYVLAQLLGAMLALVVLNAFVNAAPEVSEEAAMFGATGVQLFTAAELTEGREWLVFGAEALGAAIFGFIFASVILFRDLTRSALAIGFGFFGALIVAGFAAGAVEATAVLNPAVAVAYEAIQFDNLMSVVVYALAPAVGAAVGFGLFTLMQPQASSNAVK